MNQYEALKSDDIKNELKLTDLEKINKTKIKITKKEIENLFEKYKGELILYKLRDIDESIKDIEKIINETSKYNGDANEKIFKQLSATVISYETKFLNSVNTLLKLNNQYVSKGLEYFNKYLTDEEKIVKYDTIEKAITDNNITLLRESLGGLAYCCRDFSDGEFDRTLKYIESKGIQVKEKFNNNPPLISETKKPEDLTHDDFTSAIFELKKNFCDERIKDAKIVGKILYPDNGKYYDKLEKYKPKK